MIFSKPSEIIFANDKLEKELPDGWRLIYTIKTPNRIQILAVILEWFNHKDYERRFHY